MPHHVTGVGKPSQPNRARRRHDGRGGRRFGRLPRVLLLCDRDSKLCQPRKGWLRRRCSTSLWHIETKHAKPSSNHHRFASLLVVAAQETTMPPGCHHRATVGLFGMRMRQPIRQFRHILSVAVFPRASNAQAGPTTSDPEWASIPHFLPRGSPCFFWTWHPTATTPLVAHQFSPCADRGSSPSPSSGLNLTFIAALHRPRDRHHHFFLALTRTGPLSIYPCPPAFRQTGDSWPRSHMPCWFKTVVRSFPGSAVRPFWKFQRPKLFHSLVLTSPPG